MSLVLTHEMPEPDYNVTEFDSADMLEAMKQSPYGQNQVSMPDMGEINREYRMNKTAIYDLFREGWPAGADIALKMADDLEAVIPEPKDLRRSLHFSESGDELEIDNLYSGRFDNLFRTRKRKYKPTQTVVTIGMHLCTLWGSPESNMLSGAVGIAMARVLERFGYRVELLSLLTANGYRQDAKGKYHRAKYVGVVRVKEAYSPLNAAQIAAVHHPATSLALVRGVMARGADMVADCSCQDFASTFATKFMAQTGRRFDYCFDWIGSERSAKRELIKAVVAIGGSVFTEEGLAELAGK